MDKKVVLIGRHAPTHMPGIEVVRQENVQFPAHAEECRVLLGGLASLAQDEGAALLFQAMPGQVISGFIGMRNMPRVGIIISKPGPRLTGESMRFEFDSMQDMDHCLDAVKLSNPRVRLDVGKVEDYDFSVTVTADPPMRFEFSHIEWLN